jgi:hypothetical protein
MKYFEVLVLQELGASLLISRVDMDIDQGGVANLLIIVKPLENKKQMGRIAIRPTQVR